jgi:hypothetical protein
VTVERIRQANLQVLTTRNGSKVKLGAVLGLSGSNMAHRLHGKKRMDDAEAERFTAGLGLPAGWLDTPRAEADIPESVAQLLAPASRARAPGQAQAPTAAAAYEDTPVAATPTSENDRAVPSITSDPHTEPLPTDAAGDGGSVASAQHKNVSSAVAMRADGPVERIESHTPAAVSAPVASQPAVAMSPPADTPSSPTSATNLDGLDGISPIGAARGFVPSCANAELSGSTRKNRIGHRPLAGLTHYATRRPSPAPTSACPCAIFSTSISSADSRAT